MADNKKGSYNMAKRLIPSLLIFVFLVCLAGCSGFQTSKHEAEVPSSEKLTEELMKERIGDFLKTSKPEQKTEFVVATATEFYVYHNFIAAYEKKRRSFMVESSSAQYSPAELDQMLKAASMMIFQKYGNRSYALIELKSYNELDKTSHESMNYDQYFFAACKNDQGKWILFEVVPLFNVPGSRPEIREHVP